MRTGRYRKKVTISYTNISSVLQRAYRLLIFDGVRETFESSFWMSDGQDNQFYSTDRQFVPASRVGGGFLREGNVLFAVPTMALDDISKNDSLSDINQ